MKFPKPLIKEEHYLREYKGKVRYLKEELQRQGIMGDVIDEDKFHKEILETIRVSCYILGFVIGIIFAVLFSLII